MTDLEDWTAAASHTLGVTESVDVELVLDLAREVAHGVARPAAPVTSYLLGVAVGRGADPHAATALLRELLSPEP